jgi:site-specific DNA-methyltransferase (adenine-specific)
VIDLRLGDCLEVMRGIPDGSVDAVVTDPPYRGISGGKYNRRGWTGSILERNDGRIFAHNDIAIKNWLPEVYRVMRIGADCYVMINNLNLRELLNEADRVGLGFHNMLAWRKNTVTANRWYMKECEWVLYFYKQRARTINNPSSKQLFSWPNPNKKLHPTEKPVPLFEHYIRNSTYEGQLILDPFMGSGTTGVACVNTGRSFIGIERDPGYFQVAQERIAKAQEAHQLVFETAS